MGVLYGGSMTFELESLDRKRVANQWTAAISRPTFSENFMI